MTLENIKSIKEIKAFAQTWNELYAATNFEAMKALATEDVGIANAQESTSPTGLIYGRQAYYDGIYGAYVGIGDQRNMLVMKYEDWEYIPLGENEFYTIGKYTLQPDSVGVNCWLLRRECRGSPWRIFRVINN
ncbi:MAG: hypothetical protein COA42_11645 [Alteromonadaceae bacterium]|nr:MAG: hypothetical protein COA42_11645 [Alteromonadaceae bacterium]